MRNAAYERILNDVEARMRKLYESHDVDGYIAAKNSGEKLYAAIVAEGYSISEADGTYVVSR
jgi:hypothetical protein